METWTDRMRAVAVATLVLLTWIQSGLALNCYQCDSTLDSNCQERWDDSLTVNDQKYKVCNLWNAQFCVKVTGMWGGVVGTHRFCSSRDMGDQCQDIWFPDHDRMYRACIYTCSADGCNGSSRLSVVPRLLIGLCCSLLVIKRLLFSL